MKKLFLLLSVSLLAFGCQYDDQELWDSMNDATSRLDQIEETLNTLNSSIEDLETIVKALNEGKVILKTEQTNNGYILTFSDNSTVEITNGENGEDGETPVIGVSDYEGVYYWTITVGGEYGWLYDGDGNPVAASGTAGTTPTLGVDTDGYWTVDTGNGAEQLLDTEGNPISTKGEDGDSFFSSVEENSTTVTITLASGDVITLPKYIEYGVSVKAGSDLGFALSETKTIELVLNNVSYIDVLGNGSLWSVTVKDDSKLEITAPNNVTKEPIRLFISEDGTGECKVATINAYTYSEVRTLTFEDTDYQAGENYLGESSWSSLIDGTEYGDGVAGSLIYSNSTQYTWTDENNTFLNGVINEGIDWYTYETNWVFWNGGIAISNYYLPVVQGEEVDFTRQLSVPTGSAGAAGNNGSANFAVVTDASASGMGYPSYLSFGDNTPRVISHLYISSTSYLEYVALYGDSFADAVQDGDNYTVTAIGIDENDEETGTSIDYEFVNNGNFTKEWNKWDLSSLGEVAKIKFKISSSVKNAGGIAIPCYFAIDDIAVRF